MTTLKLDGDRYADGDGRGHVYGYGMPNGDGYGYGNRCGESRGEGYGTGYHWYAFGDTGDGGVLVRSPEPTHDILTTDDALEAFTFL
jgi:hypothetical protein